jgi:chromosome segregation ATPase
MQSDLMEEQQQLAELKETTPGGKRRQSSHADAPPADERVRLLEREVAVSKHTEMKMLESLIQQTKELEQAKIALEEAKLELATLRQHHQQGAAEPAPPQWSVMDLMFGGVDDEINGLKAKLRAAAQGEERSRKAAHDLTASLSAVTMEAKQVKAWLSDAQADLERANAEADRLRGMLQAAEAELWAATEHIDALTAEWTDAAAAWRAREKALLARARDADAARRELDGLRRALERAAEEANAAAESLELAAAESARLQDAVAEKESALEATRRESEALKASEAAARARANELEEAQRATSAATDGKATTDPPLQKWAAGEVAQGKLSAAAFLDSGRAVGAGRRDRMFASLSNLTELKSAAAAAVAMDDYSYEFDHFDVAGQYGDPHDAARQHKKRRSILRKFGDLFRRRSLYKSNLPPVLHHY